MFCPALPFLQFLPFLTESWVGQKRDGGAGAGGIPFLGVRMHVSNKR